MIFDVYKPVTLITLPYPGRVINVLKNGEFFYLNKNPKKEQKINIPLPGKYEIFNAEIKGDIPLEKVKHKIVLPKKERNFKEDNVRVEKNKNVKGPALIYAEKGLIQTGPMFETLPGVFKLFVLLHELAHLQYKTEEFCDLKAMKDFLNMGYNPTQGILALTRVLNQGQKNDKRIFETFKHIVNE